MKTKLIILAILISSSLFSQPKPVYLSRTKVGILDCSVQQISLRNKSTALLVTIEFKSEGNSDVRSISFDLQNDTLSIASFINDLKNAIAEVGNGSNRAWNNTEYSIKTFDASATIHLYEPDSRGAAATEIAKKDAQRLVTWLEVTLKNRSKFIHQQSNHKALASL
jgi:hypothetical protein